MTLQYTPMAPTLVREPFHRPGWIYEGKVDGWSAPHWPPREVAAASAVVEAYLGSPDVAVV